MRTLPVYREIIDFIAAGTTPQNLINFNPSEEAKERIAESDSSREDNRFDF